MITVDNIPIEDISGVNLAPLSGLLFTPTDNFPDLASQPPRSLARAVRFGQWNVLEAFQWRAFLLFHWKDKRHCDKRCKAVLQDWEKKNWITIQGKKDYE